VGFRRSFDCYGVGDGDGDANGDGDRERALDLVE
jgi:hypothetical protein